MNCDGARTDPYGQAPPAPPAAAIGVLQRSLEQTRTSAKQHRHNEKHYLGLRDEERTKRLRYETQAAELEDAIRHLGGRVEEVAAA